MRNEVAPGEKLLTKCEVAQLCRVEIRTVDRWVAAGKLRYYRTPSGRLLFRSSDVLIPESGPSSSTSSGNGSSSTPTGSALR
jgi:excisionase family DNA binding protein